ncbi:MAG: alpha/beta hydrolase, partial [Pseudomonadota bacterium]
GVATARALAMITYRTDAEFDHRFSCREAADGGVADYIFARGADYAAKTSAARYLSLSGAIDRHFEEPEAIDAPALFIGVDHDRITPFADMSDLAARHGGEARLVKIQSPYGHDAFLKSVDVFSPHIKTFIKETVANV